MTFRLFFFAVAILGSAAHAADKALDYELTRAYQVLERGQENRARVLFRDYLKKHPDNGWARQGFEAAGGDLGALGLKPAAEAQPAEHAEAPLKAAEPPQAQEPSPAAESAEPEPLADDEADAVIEVVVEEEGAWAKRLWERVKRTSWLALLALGVLLAVVLVIALAVLGVRFSKWHERKRNEQLEALAASTAENVFVEYRHWAPWWGLGLDSEAASNQVLARFNAAGWTCLEARREWGGLFKLPFVQILLVILVQALTLGFMRFYTGTNFLFKRAAGV